jgi:Nickel/cobalt transporter regulator
MLRVFAIAATFALALPTLALAQAPEQHRPAGRPGPARPAPRAAVVPHGPAPHGPAPRVVGHPGPVVRPGGPVVRPGVAVAHGPFVFHGRPFAWHPVRFPRPWVYPPGYAYRLWGVGAILPPLFWREPTYYYTGWADMGLPPPDPGFQYVQYGPDLLLVNVATGEVVQVFPGAFS